jgi:hypothetical protein
MPRRMMITFTFPSTDPARSGLRMRRLHIKGVIGIVHALPTGPHKEPFDSTNPATFSNQADVVWHKLTFTYDFNTGIKHFEYRCEWSHHSGALRG